VVFLVFLAPGLSENVARIKIFMNWLAIVGIVVGSLVISFWVISPEFMFLKIIVFAVSLALFMGIIAILFFTGQKIFLLAWKIKGTEEFSAVFFIGIQLFLFILINLFMILSEVGEFIGINWIDKMTLRILKNCMYLVLSILYYFAFVKPSRIKQVIIQKA